jgi:uncharacterized coiled-coil DUF342 family protein
VAQPFLQHAPPSWLRLGVAEGLVGGATLLAVLLGVLRAPRRLAAALLLDERFGLKERVTTSMTLAPGQEATAAGQALLADVNQHISKVDVPSRFPVRVSWITGAAPAVAAALALLAFYYRPPISQATSGTKDKLTEAPVNAKDIEQKLDKLKKRPAEKRPAERPMSDELKRIDAELDQIANKPRSTKEELKERIKEMTALEDRLKNRERDLADRTRSLRQQLQQMDRMANKSGNQDGPAKDLKKALSEGKMDKAAEELERLAKKIKENQLSEREKQDLAKQLKEMQEKMERLAQQKDKMEELQRLHKEGKLSQEALKKEMQQLKQDSAKLKDMQALADKLGQCQKSLKDGNCDAASKALGSAADQMKELDVSDQDLADLRDQLQRLQDAKDSC